MAAIFLEKNDENLVPWQGHFHGDKRDCLSALFTYSVLLSGDQQHEWSVSWDYEDLYSP